MDQPAVLASIMFIEVCLPPTTFTLMEIKASR